MEFIAGNHFPMCATAGAAGIRSEQAAVLYNYNVLGTQGPRKMTVLVPSPEGGRDAAPPAFRPEDGNAHALIDRCDCGDSRSCRRVSLGQLDSGS